MERSKKKKMMKMMMMMKKMMMMMEEEEEDMEEEEEEEEMKEEEEVKEIIQCKILPSDIIRDILSRLPFESLVYCRRVCKTWRTLIEDPLFFEIIHNKTTTTSSTTKSSSSSYNNDDDDDQSLCFIILTRPVQVLFSCNQELNELLYAEYNNNNNMIGDNDDDDDDQVRRRKKRKRRSHSNIQVTRPLKILYSLNHPGDQFTSSGVGWVLIGSSNGLICLCQDHGRSCRVYYICNPFTGEYLNLISDYSNAPSVANGFGYHPSTKQYKLVSIHYKGNGSFYAPFYAPYGDVKVYTLGSGRWRDKGQVPFLFPGVTQPSVLVNGALHWVTRGAKPGEIVSFDLADEEFRIVPSPPFDGYYRQKLFLKALMEDDDEEEELNKEKKEDGEKLDKDDPDFQVGVLGGCLCAAEYDSCVWVMNKYMSKESWTKSYTIDHWVMGAGARFYKLLSVLRGGALLWHRRQLGYYGFYRPKESKSGSIIEFHDKRMAPGVGRNIDIVPYIKSFVSLKALGEQDVRYAVDSKEEKKEKKKRRGKKRK